MSTRSVLIIGGSGFLGTHLALRLRDGYKVFATYFSHPVQVPGVTFIPLNLEDRNSCKHAVKTAKPDYVIYVPGPRGGENGLNCEQLYSKGAGTALAYAEIYQPKFIFVSSSSVFDGDRGNYHEGDPALPQTVAGRAKIGGENFIKSRALHSIIFRCSPLVGRGNGLNLSLLDRIRTQFDRGKPVELVSNTVHSFAPVEGFVEVLAEWIAKPTVKNRVIHYGGLTKLSYADLGLAFAKRFGFESRLVTPVLREKEEKRLLPRGEKKDILDFSLNSTQCVELLKTRPLLLEEIFDLYERKLANRA